MDRLEVLKIMAHLLITLVLIVAYVIMSIYKLDTTIIAGAVMASIGYWFGAVQIQKKGSNKNG